MRLGSRRSLRRVALCCRFFWRLHPQIPEPHQTQIMSTWPSLPNKVDAAYEYPEKDRVLVFRGGLRVLLVFAIASRRWMSDNVGPKRCVSTGIRMWALNGYNVVDGYPKYIHTLGFPKTVREIDAAVHIGDTGKTLFFADEEYWR